MSSKRVAWTNKSALRFAQGADPVEAMTQYARARVIREIDEGWEGPPFDPLRLAERLGIAVEAASDVRDARLVPVGRSRFRIEFNPHRSKRRIRYSIAHEIGHTFFPDCAEEIRNRQSAPVRGLGDEWQLEALCNIAAAEILMPIGTLSTPRAADASVDHLLELRETYAVSTEAVLLRFVHVAQEPFAVFCASRPEQSTRYRVDYLVGSRAWPFPVQRCEMPLVESVASHCTSVGFTWKGHEEWRRPKERLRVECVAIPPYPGSRYPRVAGLIAPVRETPGRPGGIETTLGDATTPRGHGSKLLAHVVNDKTPNWGGRGFARSLARRHPEAQLAFREWAEGRRLSQCLGEVHFKKLSDDLFVASMVCQHGYGSSPRRRLRYAALDDCLQKVAQFASENSLSIHMPRIGTGEAGGSWELIEELIRSAVSASGVPTTVYDLPGAPWRPSPQHSFAFG